jgi:hypothetical protein
LCGSCCCKSSKSKGGGSAGTNWSSSISFAS